MKRILFGCIVCLAAGCGSGDVGESYHTTDTAQLNQSASNELNNQTPVNDDSIGGIIQQQYQVDTTSLKTIRDSVK
ncbi:MAG: hypothetical protein EOP51_16760 [Sphingobacteriales bacterium]|nr:MAG: hypothetical protein EOP51_16760 [Sphingobacteriales bacterium]